jgi:hypothetical protein
MLLNIVEYEGENRVKNENVKKHSQVHTAPGMLLIVE